MTRFCYKFI